MDKKDEEMLKKMKESESKEEYWEKFCKSERNFLELLQEKNVKSESRNSLVLKI